ncbi:S24 family peptidase [Massilia sp. DJPM01]|uniref:LexA family transcriptional regulator n=1 Tax=Massilia sp. DJPM01 TaxID=3024404 RepID=UPI00259F8763|nr:S24 family peptidase [Massilia sp. DJPM01]MDM5178491.1 S24 family peptidase [Massilia sp. DJPM01]
MPTTSPSNHTRSDAARLKELFVDWQNRRRDAGEPYSQEYAADLLPFNQSALSQYLNGKIPLNIEAATQFAKMLGCTISDFSPTLAARYVEFQEVAAPPTQYDLPPTPLNARRVTVSNTPTRPMTAIKRVNLSLQAGIMGFEASQATDDGATLEVPTRWIEENDFVPQCLLAIEVKGDSMQPLLFEKDIVVVNIADTKKMSGRIYAINFNGEAVIKRLVYQSSEWYLESENPLHKRRMCRGGECIVVGRVVRFEAINFKDRL